MFTLQEMKAAHAKVKSGADFPAYIREIKKLGLLQYDFQIRNGQIVYHGANCFRINSDAIYPEKEISVNASPGAVKEIIVEHQQGKTDFLTFCTQVAAAGVAKWVVDTQAMSCTYYDLAGRSTVAESIPEHTY